MLVLTRMIGEFIFITNENTGEVVKICLTDILTNKKAKIGIEAADYFKIMREELLGKDNANK